MIEQIIDRKVNIKESCCIRNKNNDRLSVYNWLKEFHSENDLVEVKFKSTRKLYCVNVNNLKLEEGDLVAVSANPGHDIGVVSLTGELVNNQIMKKGIDTENREILPKIYRIARENDIEKWEFAKTKEHDFLLISRTEADRLGLDMKIGDVECQGDGTKAIFYYIADERVDFRELIKILASKCQVRIEMKQIGARQEAGRTGGIGNCGRELCCSSWLQDFKSVTNVTVREQGLSLNPSKITGQCGKLKCCMNYELDTYTELKEELTEGKDIVAEECSYVFKKLDVLSAQYTYVSDDDKQNYICISEENLKKYLALNKKGVKIKNILSSNVESAEPLFTANEEALPSHDKKSRGNRDKRRNGGNRSQRPHNKKKFNNPKGDRSEKPDRQEKNEKRDRSQRGNSSKNHSSNNRRNHHNKPRQEKEHALKSKQNGETQNEEGKRKPKNFKKRFPRKPKTEDQN